MDRQVSVGVNSIIRGALWALAVLFVVGDFYARGGRFDDMTGLGMLAGLGAAVLSMRAQVRYLLTREKQAFHMGREFESGEVHHLVDHLHH